MRCSSWSSSQVKLGGPQTEILLTISSSAMCGMCDGFHLPRDIRMSTFCQNAVRFVKIRNLCLLVSRGVHPLQNFLIFRGTFATCSPSDSDSCSSPCGMTHWNHVSNVGHYRGPRVLIQVVCCIPRCESRPRGYTRVYWSALPRFYTLRVQ
jgi:hypothetical protein